MNKMPIPAGGYKPPSGRVSLGDVELPDLKKPVAKGKAPPFVKAKGKAAVAKAAKK